MMITARGIVLPFLIILGLKETLCDIDADNRNQKHFSLFSVVTFSNEECTSESDFTGGAVKGTCYSSTECDDKDGTKSGNCAAGFGVCCVFVYSTLTSKTINENRTYFQNPLFPSTETSGAGTTTTYTISKMSSDICQLRLDFDFFVIAGPSNTGEFGVALADGNCNDALTSTVGGGAVIPTLCGVMTGQHLYMDMGYDSTDTAKLDLSLATTTITATTTSFAGITVANAFRKWRVKTSQIPCWATYRAPDGCNQYFTDSVGTIASPNFAELTYGAQGDNLLNFATNLMNIDVKYCIRREKGACCVLYQVCTQYGGIDFPNAVIGGGAAANGDVGFISDGWSFHVAIRDAPSLTAMLADDSDQGLVDAACTTDYLEIPDSNVGIKSYGATVVNFTKYCGHRMGYVPAIVSIQGVGWNSHTPIWDCTEPFEASFHTDQFEDTGTQAIATPPVVANMDRGLCLDFSQDYC